MRKKEFKLEPFKKWMREYFQKNGEAPDLSEVKVSNGSPYNKGIVLREFGSFVDACVACGIPPRSYKSTHLKSKLLNELQEAVYENRTTDRDILRKNGISDRSRYERLFGSWSKSLELAGIGAPQRYLIKYFDDYRGQDEVSFLKEKLTTDGEWGPEQLYLIDEMNKVEGDLKRFRENTNYYFVRDNFMYASLVQIVAGYQPIGVFLKRKHTALDGHENDSLQEKELDDWLHKNNFNHDIQVPYPESRMTCDFLVEDVHIEYVGFYLTNLKSYKKKIERKITHAKKQNMKLIIVYNLSQETLKRLRAALTKNVREKDTELTGNPLELN